MTDTAEPLTPAKQRPRTPLPVDREAVKAASIAGVPDSQLAKQFRISPDAIRQWRSRDPAWAGAFAALKPAKANAEALLRAQAEQLALSRQAVTKASVTENLGAIWQRNCTVMASAASKTLADFAKAPAEVEDWQTAKIVQSVLAKATGQDKPVQVVNLNLWGDSTKTVIAGDSGTDIDSGMEDWTEAEIAEGLDELPSELD